MDYHASHSWTFSSLIGAYLDLALAYLLLCGSTLVFFASKFLAIFGLYLPCPCNGLFGSDPNGSGSGCLQQRLLVDSPVTKISSVHMSLKSKPPFDSLWTDNDHVNVKLIENSEGNYQCNEIVEYEGEEASCSSLSDVRAPIRKNHTIGLGFVSRDLRGGLHGVKGKGILRERSPRFGGGGGVGVRRRRRAAVDSSRMMSERDYFTLSPSQVREITEDDSSALGDSGTDGNRYEKEAPAGVNLCEGTENMSHSDELVGEGEDLDEEPDSADELVNDKGRIIDGSDENAIRSLELALKEQHAARAVLYVELEKERSAAATAADEAMAMILRLQKEKAAIEMEARQYQRMIEEKSAYDAEEMNILKEILVRREREKHFLEKEVQVYRRMMLPENEQLNDDFPGMDTTIGEMLHSSLDDINEDPILMLQRISESIDKREMAKVAKNSSNVDFASVKESSIPDWGKGHDCLNLGDVSNSVSTKKHHLQPVESVDESKRVSQEKEMIDSKPSSAFYSSNDLHGHDLLEKTIIFIDEEQGKNDNAKLSQGISGMADQSHADAELNFPFYGIGLEKHGKNADPTIKDEHNSVSEPEPSILDVHVIDDKSKFLDERAGKESEALSNVTAPARLGKCGLQCEVSGVRGIDILCNQPSTSRGDTEINIYRSCSDMNGAVDKSLGKSLLFELRRNSMSVVDNERSKLESEVEWLRERLRIVQEGREKLSFSMEHREREKVQLQLLEDIARQLKEIRQLTEPGKAIRQASLPPPSSKVNSKKRRYRSLSSGFHTSS